MKAVIMAGGEGTRLRPMTAGRPKPMIDVMDRPVMEHIIDLMKRHGITDIAVTLMYMPQVIIDYFGDGTKFGVNIKYFIEESPLGTAGSVKNAQSFLDEDFIVISGDSLTDIDLKQAINYHNAKQAAATLVLSRVPEPLEYGVVVLDQAGAIARFLEKPSWSEVFSDTVNTGTYILKPEVLDLFAPNLKYDFSRDLFPLMLEDKMPLFGYVADGYWCDIGDLTAYAQCHKDILAGMVKINMNAELRGEIYVGEGATIEGEVEAPAYIGAGAYIAAGAEVSANSVIGRESRVMEGAQVNQSILHRGVTLANLSQLYGCMIGENASIGSFSSVFENAVVGANTTIQAMCEVKSGIKIWNNKLVTKGSVVDVNLVWGSGFSRKIFDDDGLQGEINIEITPEFATKLGATFGAKLGGGSVGIGYGGGGPLLMLKNAFISGLLSSGCEVFDFDVQTLPLTRRSVPFYDLDGGVHLTLLQGSLFINFLSKTGADMSRDAERSLEVLFNREDFKRAAPDKIKNVTQLPDYNSYYLREAAQITKDKEAPIAVSVITECDVAMNLVITSLSRLASTIHTNSPDGVIRALIDIRGENTTLVDECGRKVDMNSFLMTVLHILKVQNEITEFVAPISASNILEEVAGRLGIQVIRCKTSQRDIMKEIAERDLCPQLYIMYDPVYLLSQLLVFLHEHETRLCDFIDGIPDIHMAEREISCAPYRKGTVMRTLAAEGYVSTPEGVRIERDNGWVLVLPHSSRPVCRVISEGVDTEFAEELCDIYAGRIREIAGK